MKLIYRLKNDYFGKVNWMLLLFIILVLYVKMPVKIISIFIFLLLNRKLFKNKELFKQRFIWFYFAMIAIGVLDLVLSFSSISVPYIVAVLVGIMFWLLCAGAAFLISGWIAGTDTSKLHSTISLFFVLNAAVSIIQLLLIIRDAGSVNPYIYQGMHQKYFISTGDMVTGISFDVSTTNAVLNAFGVVYFLKRNKFHLGLMCMLVLLLATSNFTNVLLFFVFAFLFVFQSNRNQKSVIIVCLFMMTIFMLRISPHNDNYIIESYNKVFHKNVKTIVIYKPLPSIITKPDSLLTAEEKKQKIARQYLDSLAFVFAKAKREEDSVKNPGTVLSGITGPVSKPFIPKPSIHTEPFQRRRDTTAFQKELLDFAEKRVQAFDTSLKSTESRKIPGKLIAFKQTFAFLKKHPLKIITGSGMGKFSSKLAFRATGLGMAGSYPMSMTYINDDFLNNHLNLYLTYFSKDKELHSLINSPNSVYDQLLAEYGLLGILAFVLLYLAFFVKHLRRLTYGIPLFLLLLGSFGVDYWYEQLSIVIVFEFLMLLNIKETKENG